MVCVTENNQKAGKRPTRLARRQPETGLGWGLRSGAEAHQPETENNDSAKG